MDEKYAFLDRVEERGFTNHFLESRHSNRLFTQSYRDFDLTENPGSATHDNTNYRDILKTIQQRTPVSDFFFGQKNLDHLQQLIIRLIYERSNGLYKISRQSDNELLIVMRSIYLQYAKHLPEDVRGQVCELNRQVILDVVPKIMSNVQLYMAYMRDQGSNIRPIDRPQFESSAGTRTNRSVTSLFI